MGKTVEDMSGEGFRQTLETNLFGVFYACHYAVPMMRERGGGYIINISGRRGS
jgi:NAD(P)-dependent dehydrogenase (short-subunit alcohol dehydrogenase family)